MTKLLNIEGYWNTSGTNSFNANDMWEGQIILNDNNWFEGVAVDKNSSYTEDRFIFGIYYPDKFIELYKFTPIEVTSPFVFHGKKTAEGYDGKFEVIELMGSIPYGSSQLKLFDSKVKEENINKEVQRLKDRTERYKVFFMDDVGKEFYDNAIAMRTSMARIFLRNYEGGKFTPAEIQEIMSECQPVNERVIASTKQAVRKLVKEQLDDSDDLPF